MRRPLYQVESAPANRLSLCWTIDLLPEKWRKKTFTEKGLIKQANLSAASQLAMVRSVLVRQPISRFIVKEDQDDYLL